MSMLRYAGYDPAENEFDTAGFTPLPHEDLGQNAPIDTQRALELRRSGYSWDKIGRLLAAEANRLMPYRGLSVYFAVRRAE
jgi:hypothetical protein